MELVDAWERIQARLNAGRPSRRQGTTKTFSEYAWDEFVPREVLKILATPEPSYFAHKDVLYEGFCGWVADPSGVNLRKHAMVLRAALHLDTAEKAGRKRYGDVERLGDILIRTHLVDPEFFEEIYYPIGGIRRIARSLSCAGYRGKLRKCARLTECTVRIVEIYHYHVENLLLQRTYGKPSLNSASAVVGEIFDDPKNIPDRRRIKEFWRQRKASAAFAYAAKSMQLNDSETLLSALLGGNTTWRKHGHLFPQWLARTRFLAEHVLGQCAETDTARDTLAMLPDTEADVVAPPALNKQQVILIGNQFKRKNASKKDPSAD